MNENSEFLEPNDCLLLLVDIQKVLLDLCPEAEQLVRNVLALMEVADIFDIPVIFSVQNVEKLGGCLPELVAHAPRAMVLNKLEFSCLENEGLAHAIREPGRRTLLLAGLEAHVCVFHTAVQSLRVGYRVHVAADGVTSRSLFNREIGLRRMEKSGVVISSTEMVIFELLKRAGTLEFKKALPLLKTL